MIHFNKDYQTRHHNTCLLQAIVWKFLKTISNIAMEKNGMLNHILDSNNHYSASNKNKPKLIWN